MSLSFPTITLSKTPIYFLFSIFPVSVNSFYAYFLSSYFFLFIFYRKTSCKFSCLVSNRFSGWTGKEKVQFLLTVRNRRRSHILHTFSFWNQAEPAANSTKNTFNTFTTVKAHLQEPSKTRGHAIPFEGDLDSDNILLFLQRPSSTPGKENVDSHHINFLLIIRTKKKLSLIYISIQKKTLKIKTINTKNT